LIITWNTGKSGANQPSVPFSELMRFWQQRQSKNE